MTTINTIAGEFDKARYDKLRKAYDNAGKQRSEQYVFGEEFFFEGEPILFTFAKYLLKFLAPHFKDMK